jgi:hypothetical protein
LDGLVPALDFARGGRGSGFGQPLRLMQKCSETVGRARVS